MCVCVRGKFVLGESLCEGKLCVEVKVCLLERVCGGKCVHVENELCACGKQTVAVWKLECMENEL